MSYMERWLYSTNCKDISILYIIFAVFAGLIGTGLSIIIRLELAGPSAQILQNNGQLFNVVISLHAVMMIFFMVMPISIGFFGNLNYILNDINKLNNNIKKPLVYNSNIVNYNILNSYLAGLIEGNGTICIKSINNISKLKIPKISIVFNIKDKYLADYLCNITNCGIVNIKKGNYILWEIKNFHDVYHIITLINGYMRTPKYEILSRVILWYNDYINKYKNMNLSEYKFKGWDIINIPRSIKLCKDLDLIINKGLDKSDLFSNSWFSGITDANGKFSISLYKNKKISIKYKLELKQYYLSNILKYNTNYESLIIMNYISMVFNSKLYSKSRLLKFKDKNKIYNKYIVNITNINSLLLVNKYFDKYPLLSSKKNDYIIWSKVLNKINIEGHNIITYKYVYNIKNKSNKL